MKILRIADLFCGAGGTSTGAMEAAERLGYQVELTAINHWEVAIATHKLNHPRARHRDTNIENVNPRTLFREGELDVLWASPECTHHSQARGGRPINDQSRATAWCVLRWMEALRPPVVLMENVPAFVSWGPVDVRGRPLKSKKGETFEALLQAMRSMNYRPEWRIVNFADYGDPTTRERLIIYAVRGKRRVVWPRPTHGEHGVRPWVTAEEEVIDWALEGKSIFTRKAPLVVKSLRRILIGLERFALAPFLLPSKSGDKRARSVKRPVHSVTTESRGEALIESFIVGCEHMGANGAEVRSATEPVSTVSGHARKAVATAFIVESRGTADAQIETKARHSLLRPFFVQYFGTGTVRETDRPMPSQTTKDRFALNRPSLEVVDYEGACFRRVEYLAWKRLVIAQTAQRAKLTRLFIQIGEQIGMLEITHRMLQVHELAAAQGFRRDYKFAGNKTEQVKQIGNAVPRRGARALVAAALTQNADVRHIADLGETEAAA